MVGFILYAELKAFAAFDKADLHSIQSAGGVHCHRLIFSVQPPIASISGVSNSNVLDRTYLE